MKRFKMPTAYTILLAIILVIAVLTFVLPAGQYEYNAEGEPIAGTYHTIPSNGQGLDAVVLAPLQGLYEAIEIAVFILTVGCFLGVMGKTGAIDAGIAAIIRKLKGREKLLIPILMCAFALGGTTFGMAEETIAFYPLLLPVMLSAGYDAITAVAVILLGAGAGVLGSTVNPFATGIAAGFAGVSLGEGIVLRLVILAASLVVAIFFVMRYGERVRAHPEKSLLRRQREGDIRRFVTAQTPDAAVMTPRRRAALILFGLTFAVMIYGVIPFEDMGITLLPTLGWWFLELSALFWVASVVVGLVYGLPEVDIAEGFVHGAGELLGVSFIIGISRGITVVMNNGGITDTILHWGEESLTGVGRVPFVLVSYLIYLVLSFLIPSTSGLATLSMPIMAPLADFSGVGRDLVITVFQSASGLVNLVTPTSAVVMGALAIGRVPYHQWLKFVWKLLVLFLLLSILLMVLQVLL